MHRAPEKHFRLPWRQQIPVCPELALIERPVEALSEGRGSVGAVVLFDSGLCDGLQTQLEAGSRGDEVRLADDGADDGVAGSEGPRWRSGEIDLEILRGCWFGHGCFPGICVFACFILVPDGGFYMGFIWVLYPARGTACHRGRVVASGETPHRAVFAVLRQP